MPFRVAVAVLVIASAMTWLIRPVDAADLWVNPGTMGPNALPTQPGERAWVPDQVQLRIEAAGQLTRAGDRSFVPAFRLETPFGRWVSIISEGRPMEVWRISPATRADWDTSSESGVSQGDLLFGVKFVVFHGGERWPAVAIRNVTKTTTGKDYRERRFTNAPAYLIDALVSQHLPGLGAWELEAWGSVGFFAWQQGQNGQNDALSWSGTLAARAPAGHALRAELRGYAGWQEADKPVVASLSLDWRLAERVDLVTTFNAGVRDAPALDARVGVLVRLPSLLPLRVGD